MGLFSGSKKTYVSSVVYNLAGPEDDRADYLKTMVISNIMSSRPTSISNTIKEGYLGGPGIKLRNFTRWAKTSGYSDLLGLRDSELSGQSSLTFSDVSPHIPHTNDETVIVESAEISSGEVVYWVDRYMLDNRPNRINDAYTFDYNNSNDTVTITYGNGDVDTFNPTGFNPNNEYLYVSYKLSEEFESEPVIIGDRVNLPSGESFPSMSGWEKGETIVAEIDVELVTIVETRISYSDDTPSETTINSSTNSTSYTNSSVEWVKVEYEGINSKLNKINSKRFTQYHTETGSVVQTVDTKTTTEVIEDDVTGTSVTVTTTVTTTKDVIRYTKAVRENTQLIDIKIWSNLRLFIYAKGGSNAALNAMFNASSTMGSFFPFIPIREDNTFLSPDFYGEIYDRSKYAMKKAVDANYTKMIDDIADNESIGDIDYAYAVFGVSLNVQENSCRKYIYNFFSAIRENSSLSGSISEYQAWRDEWLQANNARDEYGIWKRAQRQPSSPLYGAPEPDQPPYPPPPFGQIEFVADGPIEFKFEISWNYMNESTGVGKLREDKNQGELWFEIGSSDKYDEGFGNADSELNRTYTVGRITLYWQVTEQSWRSLTIAGLRHKNLVYKGKSVEVSAIDALDDSEESGFIIPLHDDIYKAMSLKDATQMSTACSFIVFNSYQVVKQKWYQTGVFKVFVIIIAIVITIYFPPAGGILGPATQVGTALGFTGTAAIIAGTIANAIAAIVITQIIQRGATMLLGDKVGSVVGAIAAVVAIAVGSAYMDGSSVSAGFSSLTKADNLLKLTHAAGEGYAGYMQGAISESQAKTQELLNEYAETSQQINEQYEKLFGNSGGIVDPTVFTGAVQDSYYYETSTEFIDRTLMLGSDIAELSIRLLDNFVEITTSTDLH